MAEMFSSLSDFKPFVGGAVNNTVELASLEPVIYDTARRHLVPWLGQTFYDAIVGGSHTALVPLVRRPLAILTMYEYSKVASVEFGEAGMFRMETSDRKSAFKYQENMYREYMLEKGYDALEYLLKFLDDNKGTYTTWAGTDEAMMHRAPLLNYAADFRRLASVQCDRYTFETLRPIIADVEIFAVQKLVPTTFWSGFIARHKAGTLTAQEKALRNLMRTAIAHRALSEATKLHWVHVQKGKVFVVEDTADTFSNARPTPQPFAGGMSQAAQEIWADRHTSVWRQYIVENKADFATVFDTDSGGSNTGTDAWHINTDDEQADANAALITEKKRPVYNF